MSVSPRRATSSRRVNSPSSPNVSRNRHALREADARTRTWSCSPGSCGCSVPAAAGVTSTALDAPSGVTHWRRLRYWHRRSGYRRVWRTLLNFLVQSNTDSGCRLAGWHDG